MAVEGQPAIAPRTIERTGDDAPTKTVWGYIRRMSGWHQAFACLLAIATSAVHLVPIELQRRVIDDAISASNVRLLIILGAAYAGALLLNSVMKFLLRMYQSWLSESAIIYTRRHLLSLYAGHVHQDEEAGRVVSIVGQEADRLGSFVGEGPSEACASVALFIGAIGYMAIVQPAIAAVSIGLLVPQILLTPVIQRRLNRLIEQRLALLRELGDEIASGEEGHEEPTGRLLVHVYRNRIAFYFWKFFMKVALNLLNGLAPLSILIWGGWLAIQGQTTLGVLVAFISAFDRISSPVRQLITFYRLANQAAVQHEMIAKWMRA